MSGPFTAREFRDALSTFATGVTIVTAKDSDGQPVGMTASSFNSVSTDPPLILWSVTKTALSAAAFHAAEFFAVHVLASNQTDLSNRFAKSGADKFAGLEDNTNTQSVPVLSDCTTRFDCETWAIYEGGDHWIIVGKVLDIQTSRKEALVFGGGTYATASPLPDFAKSAPPSGDQSPGAENLIFYHLSRAYHQMGQQFHQAVLDSGSTIAEWRVAASLFAEARHSYSELCQRTFLDRQSLEDILADMVSDDLAILSEEGGRSYAQGTLKGSREVQHLFDLAGQQEAAALAQMPEEQADNLRAALDHLVRKTGSSEIN